MRKRIISFLLLLILTIIYLYTANITLIPENIILMQGEEIKLAKIWGINIKKENIVNADIGYLDNDEILQTSGKITENSFKNAGNIKLSVNIFNDIPLKEINVNIVPKVEVVPLGNAIGLKLYTDGVLIVGMSEIEGQKPYENLDIKEGDRIISINNKKIENTEDLVEIINNEKGKEVSMRYERQDEEKEVTITPVKTLDDKYKLGLWVRDAAAGVGTATFYIPSTGTFAALGHGITDADTGELIEIADGEFVTTNIVSIKKGLKGTPGEIKGSIESGIKIGEVSQNTKFGVFGKLNNVSMLNTNLEKMEVANRSEIKLGKAQIVCELTTGQKEYYDIEIQKININNNNDNKSMYIKITDEKLLKKTGGIIQGMSGSPIVQDGKFIGAVTHVLVSDPTSGYGVFADMMLKQML